MDMVDMDIVELAIAGVRLIRPRKFADPRGFFSETYSRRAFHDAGIACDFVQDNHSRSTAAGTVRGLHFQRPPHTQAKLVRVVRGRIFDVAVDLRQTSPSYGRHVSMELSAASLSALFVPAGFAHGFCTLEPDTEVTYKVDSYYAPSHDGGILWSDPDLAIDWPVEPTAAMVSDKDARLPRLKDIGAIF